MGHDPALGRCAHWLGRWICRWRGHDIVLSITPGRVGLVCGSCGYESPGWSLTSPPPRRRFEGDRRRHEIPRVRILRKRA